MVMVLMMMSAVQRCSDFMDEACVGKDPHFPSDDKCSSDEELDDDEEVDDLHNAPEARPTAGHLQKKKCAASVQTPVLGHL